MNSEGIAYRQLYEEGRKALRDVPDGDLDARLLLEEVCGTSLQTLLVSPDHPVGQQEAARYRGFLERRRKREPLSMIVGHTGFMGLDFKVTKDVLIPEQDTEILVEEAIRQAQRRMDAAQNSGHGDSPAGKCCLRLLDLCCGSGCIMLSLLHYLLPERKDAVPDTAGRAVSTESLKGRQRQGRRYAARIAAVCSDISAKALAVAMENAERLGWARENPGTDYEHSGTVQEHPDAVQAETAVPGGADQSGMPPAVYRYPGTDWTLTFCQGDLFEALKKLPSGAGGPEPDGRMPGFDLILSNPPYIPDAVIPTLAPEVKEGEPLLALSGGEDGLAFYRRIAREAPMHLTDGGSLLLEIGYDQARSVKELLQDAGFRNIAVWKDYGGNDRVVGAAAGKGIYVRES